MSGGLTCDEVRDLAPAFVLGALEADEAERVRSHLASCPEAHAEVAELGSVVPALALAVDPVEPRPELKARIRAAAAADLAARAPRVPSPMPAPATVPFPGAAERAARRGGGAGPGTWLLRAAAVLAIVALAGWNVLLQGQLADTRDRIARSEAYGAAIAEVLDVAALPGAVTAVLTPQDGGGGRGLAAIGPDGAVRLAVRDLPATTGDQVYEAWAIQGDAPPVPLGGFRVDESGTGTFDATGVPAAEGVVLALTLEPGPGATSPTLPVISLGTAAAPPS